MFEKLNIILAKRMQVANAPVVMFGILGFINYPVFYLVWHYFTEQNSNGLGLRLIAAALCSCLILKNYWPQKLRRYLPLFWYFTVIYCLPFFGSYMFLVNHGSVMWQTNVMLIVFWLILSVDWISFVFVLFIGIVLGAGLFWLIDYKGSSEILSSAMIPTFVNFLWAIVIAAMMTQNREKLNRARFQGMRIAGASIAHELRTPLVTIHAGIEKVKDILPRYYQAYELAEKNKLPVPAISMGDHDLINQVIEDISEETKFSDTIISMLLVKLTSNIDTNTFTICSIRKCINEAICRYPFQEGEREIICWDDGEDFPFVGQKLLMIHVFFNLIKNALYSINQRGKGEIIITVSSARRFNILSFKDTGGGISSKYKTKVFEQYFTMSHHGKGIGLAFCKLVMETLGGKISLDSQEGKYADFKLYFPKVKEVSEPGNASSNDK